MRSLSNELMEKRQLDFSAPLLSIRRSSSPSNSSELVTHKVTDKMPQPKSHLWEYEDATKPAGIPFQWEHIPGRSKNGLEAQIHTPDTPKLPPGRLPGPTRFSSGEISNDQKLHETSNFKDESDNETDTQRESCSLNYSVSELSGYQTSDVKKPCGKFSIDTQTRDLMMDRFLPAAKAVVLETPKYAIKKKPMVFEEKPKPVKKVVSEERNPLLENYGSNALPYYSEYIVNNVESDDEESEFPVTEKKSGKLAWGIISRFCANNSLCLLNPSSESKSTRRPHSGPLDMKIENKSGGMSRIRHYRCGSISHESQKSRFPEVEKCNDNKKIASSCKLFKAFKDISGPSEKKDIPISKAEGLVSDQTEDIKPNQEVDYLKSPLSLPLPKAPSESWLWRTLPSISLPNPFSYSRNRSCFRKSSASDTKWETIVISSNARNDPVRFSEELIRHASRLTD